MQDGVGRQDRQVSVGEVDHPGLRVLEELDGGDLDQVVTGDDGRTDAADRVVEGVRDVLVSEDHAEVGVVLETLSLYGQIVNRLYFFLQNRHLKSSHRTVHSPQILQLLGAVYEGVVSDEAIDKLLAHRAQLVEGT